MGPQPSTLGRSRQHNAAGGRTCTAGCGEVQWPVLWMSRVPTCPSYSWGTTGARAPPHMPGGSNQQHLVTYFVHLEDLLLHIILICSWALWNEEGWGGLLNPLQDTSSSLKREVDWICECVFHLLCMVRTEFLLRCPGCKLSTDIIEMFFHLMCLART